MARLAVSAEFVKPGLVGGTEQALRYTLGGLSGSLTSGDELLVIADDYVNIAGPDITVVAPAREANPRFIQEWLTLRTLGRRVDSMFFPNYFTPPSPRTCRVVTTIPDLQYLHLPENFSFRKRAWLRTAHRYTLRRADTVTVYSDFVRSDIERHYGDRYVSKVSVLPIPVSWNLFGEQAVARERPYVLSVASHYHHKNLATLVRSFARVHERAPDLELVLVGQFGSNLIGVRRSDDVRALIEELGLGDVVHTTGYVTPHELGAWYRGAELFVFPSTFEGFGLPPVEALGFGLPVITTRLTSLPEVTLGYAEYVDDAFDTDELADRIVAQIESGARPSAETVANIRETYAPERTGKQLYDLMTSGIA